MMRNTKQSWGSAARLFHWGLGFAIIGMLAYGWWMNHMAARPDRLFYRSIHADIGYVILLLMVIRLVWRAINPAPEPAADTPRWERILASATHWALYAVTIIVALLGWAHSGAHDPSYADWFGLFRVPQFTTPDKATASFFEHRHIYAAYVLAGLVALHVVAALYHHFIKHDSVTARMVSGEAG